MHPRFFITLFAIIISFSCNIKGEDEIPDSLHSLNFGTKENHSLAIVPFKGVDSGVLKKIKNGLQKNLVIAITILDEAELPSFAFYKPRQRYIADSLLVFLGQINNGRFEKIIGVTTKDISTKKEPHVNWGILGLGDCPGEACVISSFRAGKNKISGKDFIQRMITLALHEIGHTYGLEHCSVANCIMKDAEGKMNLDDGNSYCEACRNYLKGVGVLE